MGEYMTLGGVIAEVKGVPIYANRVLREIAPALAANARVMNEHEYRNAAMDLIHKQTELLIDNELAFAAAQQSLEDRDKQLADALTTMWRQRQITDAGGSLELARQRAPEIAQKNNMPDDLSFEQLVQEKYREYMSRLWVQRKIKPRVQVTQEEMRDFYNRHLAGHIYAARSGQISAHCDRSRRHRGPRTGIDQDSRSPPACHQWRRF